MKRQFPEEAVCTKTTGSRLDQQRGEIQTHIVLDNLIFCHKYTFVGNPPHPTICSPISFYFRNPTNHYYGVVEPRFEGNTHQ